MPIRFQTALGLLLVGLSAISVATLGAFVYTSSRDAVVRDAVRTVGLTASARRTALLLRLNARRDRAETFLTAVAEGPGLAGMRREAAVRSALAVSQSTRAEPADAAKAREILTRQTTQLTRLVDDLLDVTRISSGKILLRRSTVDIIRIARDSLEDIRPAVAGKGLALEVDLPADPLWVEGDRARLPQAISNVLQNALKFTERGGAIRVAAAATPDEVEISVEDTGIGMDAETLELVFQPFAQAEHGRGGLGLGMSLVRNLVELRGGRVLAESEGSRQGSRFTLTFPLVAAPAEPEARAEEFAIVPRRLLVVEDNPDAAESLKMLLELSGHTVIAVGSGREALAALDELHPDVVLCDIGLPGEMDGLAVASAIRAREGAPYLIALSGYGQRDDKRRAHEAGFDEHVTKPVSPVDLEKILASAPRREVAPPR
jgi:signal transduction histidine kinase/ActR/RegA family two-component response regulator